jgi:hypothetical protein
MANSTTFTKKTSTFTDKTSSMVNYQDVFNESESRRNFTIPLALCLSAVAFLLLPVNQKTLGESLINQVFNKFHNPILELPVFYQAKLKKAPIIVKQIPNSNLADKIIYYMKRQGYQVFTGQGNYNIVYIEGMNLDETPNDNEPNEFNDLRLVIEVVDGKPRIVNRWEATTEPGILYTQNPQDFRGAFRIQAGQYTAWQLDYHWGSGGNPQEALIQVKPVSGYRDYYQSYKREGDVYTGFYDINQHHANDAPFDNIGLYGAGCLVGRTKAGHEEFLEILKSDNRYQKNPDFVFTTTIILANSLE